jgi:methionine-rich copper-binding protein CopC
MTRALLLAAAALLAAGAAHAEPKLAKAQPAADSAGAAPKAIELEFNETVAPKDSVVQLMRNDTGANVEVAAQPAKDGKSLQATPNSPLTPGSYMVMWSAAGADGARANGDYNFTVK